MSNLKQNIIFYLVTVLSIVIIFFYIRSEIRSSHKTITITKDSVIVVMMDTTHHSNTTTLLQPINNTYVVNHEAVVDTLKLINDYYTKRFFKTVTGDSLIEITTADTVYKNGITNKKTSWHFLKPYQVTKSYTTTIEKTIDKTTGFYLGAFAGINKTAYSFGAGANYIFKNNNVGLGYDFLNKGAQINYSRKIGKK